MELRPYQKEFVDAVEKSFSAGKKRIMGVAATGAGKTILASEIMRREKGNCLFLADAQELIRQNADKFQNWSGERAGIEMSSQQAGGERVIVATTQSLARRLDKYPKDYFNLIIADEAHRNALGDQAQSIFDHFDPYARVLGITATPFRSDKKRLGDFFEEICVDIGLERLIREGFLSRIMVRSIPMKLDISKVSSRGGDYKASELGAIIEPILREAAEQIKKHASDRKKIVIFLPLVKSSIRMARICNEIGLKAVHVDGTDKEQMDQFVKGDARVICNAQLLTTGWDCPEVDCVVMLRPTKSLAMFSQCVGRGTRICKGKSDLLLLDPLYLTDDHKLITPAKLIARDEDQAKAMMERIQSEGADSSDLLALDKDVEEQRAEQLRQIMEAKRKKKSRYVDILDFSLSCNTTEIAEYEPTFKWESVNPTEKQLATLEKAGFDTTNIRSKGEASKVIDLLFTRRAQGLATPKQLRILKRFNIPNAAKLTFEEASAALDARLGGGSDKPKIQIKKKENPSNLLPSAMVLRLKKAGLNPLEFSSALEANRALTQK